MFKDLNKANFSQQNEVSENGFQKLGQYLMKIENILDTAHFIILLTHRVFILKKKKTKGLVVHSSANEGAPIQVSPSCQIHLFIVNNFYFVCHGDRIQNSGQVLFQSRVKGKAP